MKQATSFIFFIVFVCFSADFVFSQPDVSSVVTSVNLLVNQGEQSLKDRNFVEAKRLFTEAIAAEDKVQLGAARRNPRAHIGLGTALKGSGDIAGGDLVIANWFKNEASDVSAYVSVINSQANFDVRPPSPIVDYLTEIILLEPENPAYFVARARVFRRSTPAAVADYNTALILDPKYLLALRERGELFLWSGEYEKALADFELYAQSGGDSQVYRLRRGMTILMKSGATAEALQDLTAASSGADANLRGEAFYYRGWANFLANNRPAAQTDMTEAAKADPKRRTDFYYRIVFEAFQAGKCKSEKDIRNARDDAYGNKKIPNRRELSFEMFRINTAAIACYPSTGKFNYQRVRSAETIGEFSGNPLLDVSDMRRHESVDKDNLDPNFKGLMVGTLSRAGIVLSIPDELQELNHIYYRVQRNGFLPGDTAGNLKRALADLEKSEFHRAIAVLNGILRVEPNNLAAREGRMRAFYLKRAIIRADKEAAEILKVSPNNANALNIRGLHDFEANRPESAIAYFDRAIAADPQSPKAIVNRGRVNLSRKNYAAALVDFERGIKLAPKVSYYLVQRGDAHYGMEKWEDAAASYIEAILLDEKDHQTRFKLIRTLDKAGRQKLADTHHGWLIVNAPDYAGTKALASRNPQLTADITNLVEGQRHYRRIVDLFEKVANESSAIESIIEKPEPTLRPERLDRLRKLRSYWYSILSDIGDIEYSYNKLQTNSYPITPENMNTALKFVTEAKKIKELALTERKRVDAELKEVQGYL